MPTPKRRDVPKDRGLGSRHSKQRKWLLKVHQEGTPCWWCAKPMYTDAVLNPDGLVLQADHSIARSAGGMGTLADRLLHGSCNASRGNGSRDHIRPALQEKMQGSSTEDESPGGSIQLGGIRI